MELLLKSERLLERETMEGLLLGVPSTSRPEPESREEAMEVAGEIIDDFVEMWRVNIFQQSETVVEAATRRVVRNTPAGKDATYRELTQKMCEALQKATETVVRSLKGEVETGLR